MKRVYHPVLPDASYEVPDSKVDDWKAMGWLTSLPKVEKKSPAPAKPVLAKKDAK